MVPLYKNRDYLVRFSMIVMLLVTASCSGGGNNNGGSSSGGDNNYVPPPIPSWGTAELIENNPGLASIPQIAMDGTGVAIAVWLHSDNIRYNVWANRFEGTAWGTPELIETDNTGSAAFPQIAMDGTGTAIAVWSQYDGTHDNIWANRFDGTAWGTAELIETDNTGSAFVPQIAMDGTGTAIAIWRQNTDTGDNICANRFDGTAWGTAELIKTDNDVWAAFPQIAMDSTGTAIALWIQYDGTSTNICANRFDGTAWGTSGPIETEYADSVTNPRIAMDGTGAAIVVWMQYDGTQYNICANRFNGTAWGTAELIETGSYSVNNPQVAMSENGTAIAVWEEGETTRRSICVNRFDGTAWGTTRLIESNAGGNAHVPQVAMNSTGDAIIVWSLSYGTSANIWANRFSGAAWGTAKLIESGDTDYADVPQIAMDDTGTAIAVWEQDDGVNRNIWAHRFD